MKPKKGEMLEIVKSLNRLGRLSCLFLVGLHRVGLSISQQLKLPQCHREWILTPAPSALFRPFLAPFFGVGSSSFLSPSTVFPAYPAKSYSIPSSASSLRFFSSRVNRRFLIDSFFSSVLGCGHRRLKLVRYSTRTDLR